MVLMGPSSVSFIKVPIAWSGVQTTRGKLEPHGACEQGAAWSDNKLYFDSVRSFHVSSGNKDKPERKGKERHVLHRDEIFIPVADKPSCCVDTGDTHVNICGVGNSSSENQTTLP